MRATETQHDSYNELKDSGKLGKRTQEVYDWFLAQGRVRSCWDAELALNMTHQLCSGRISDLLDRGLLVHDGYTTNIATKKQNRTYRAVDADKAVPRVKKVKLDPAAPVPEPVEVDLEQLVYCTKTTLLEQLIRSGFLQPEARSDTNMKLVFTLDGSSIAGELRRQGIPVKPRKKVDPRQEEMPL